MTILERKILNLTKQLLPTGRAFRVAPDSNKERMLVALGRDYADAHNAGTNVLSALIPDNDQFTVDDATDWERRLGLITNQMTPLADRLAAILRKMAAPGTNPARQHYTWLQKQIQDAGFANLYLYENIPLVNPAVLNANILSPSEHGSWQHGGIQSHYLNNVVVNSIYNSQDIGFDFGADLSSCFLVGAGPATPGVYANVAATRELELRQLLLTIKPVSAGAILFINYV